tara:strand:- start:4065 stop:4499 length:435 start_codon:yes stop_codon:yes gene_type:complete
MVSPIIAAGLGKLATTVGKKAAKKFVKVKDLEGFVKSLKKKKTKTKDDIDNIKKGEDMLDKKRNEEGLQLFRELKKARGGSKKYTRNEGQTTRERKMNMYRDMIEENPTTIDSEATVRMKARGGKVKYNVGGIVNPSFSNKFRG